jgi:hypothetical protein
MLNKEFLLSLLQTNVTYLKNRQSLILRLKTQKIIKKISEDPQRIKTLNPKMMKMK